MILKPLLLLPNMIFGNKMVKTWCVGGRHYTESINKNVYEKINPKTKTPVKIIKSSCSNCGRVKSQIIT